MNKPERITAGEPVGGDPDRCQLRSLIERIENVEASIKDRNDDKAEIYAEARGNGFNVKVMKMVVKRRRADRDKRIEEEAILSLYLQELGDI